MRIQPIVEGHAEVEAVPVLLRRFIIEARLYTLSVNPPIRYHRSQLVQEASLKRAVNLAAIQPDCAGILILFDSDDDCPAQCARKVTDWAREQVSHIPVSAVMASKEYEAWFIAAATSLRGLRGIRMDAQTPKFPEEIRDAKGYMNDLMETGSFYSQRLDQPALSQSFDMIAAYHGSRSFRKMTKAFGDLAVAMGMAVSIWPPSNWLDIS